VKVEIMDIEVFKNFFCYTGLNRDTEEIFQIQIYNSYTQLLQLIDHLNTLDGQIGFNNINYDYPVLYYILKNYKEWSIFEIETILEFIYLESNRIINEEWTEIPYWNVTIPQLDLFRIWHFDNKARHTSLKAIEIAIDFPNVQDIPFDENHEVKESEIQSILDYNLNDVNATYEFYKITVNQGKIELRKDIKKKYGIHCTNYNDVKIGDAINKSIYCNITGKSPKELRDLRTYRSSIHLKNCIPNYIKFNSIIFNDLLNKIKNTTIVKTKGELEFSIVYNETKYNIKTGGLHSHDQPRHIRNSDDYHIIDADVSSYYPATILNLKLYPQHLGKEWLEGYQKIFNNRIQAKKEGNKSVAEALKLALNGGGFGKTNESYNWQYDPLIMTSVTIGGQLSLLMLIEQLEDNEIQVLSANTDGIVSKVHKDKEELYYKICKEWESITNYNLEYSYYKQLIQTSVNDYIAEKIDGDIKYKGDFEFNFEKELHKNPSMKIRAIALKEYFINNIPIEETIKNHKNIYNFCKRFRNSKGWYTYKYYAGNDKIIKKKLSKNIRYYISNNGDKITKENINDGRRIDIEANVGVTVFNKYIEKNIEDYNIDYSYYISETRKILLSINDGQLKLF